MAQARRIKRKPAKKKAKSSSWFSGLPWGLMFVILISGVVLGMLFTGTQQDNGQLGQGLKALIEDQSEQAKTDSSTPEPVVKPSEDTQQTNFDYYDVLPDIEQVMPNDLPDGAVAARRTDGYQYYVQIASFRARADAEGLRAKLALQGVTALTQASEVEGKGLYYRVRLGPFANARLAKNAKARLNGLGQDPLIYRETLPKP